MVTRQRVCATGVQVASLGAVGAGTAARDVALMRAELREALPWAPVPVAPGDVVGEVKQQVRGILSVAATHAAAADAVF
jgi:hypothetical protein